MPPFGKSYLAVSDSSKLVHKTAASYFARLTPDSRSTVVSTSGDSFVARLIQTASNALFEELSSRPSYFSRIDATSTPDFTETSQGVEVIFGNSGVPVTAGKTLYIGTILDSSESAVRIPMPAVTITELYVACSTAPGSNQTFTYTVMKNGVATALSAQISGSGVSSSDTGESISFSAGDTLSVRVVTSAAAATAYHSYAIKVS